MALKLLIKSDIGIATEYHRISAIDVTTGKLNITVNSYADDTYRAKEKQNIENKEQMQLLTDQFNQECNKEVQDSTVLDGLSTQISELRAAVDNNNYVIFTNTHSFDFDIDEDEISWTLGYSKLKELDVFTNSEDA